MFARFAWPVGAACGVLAGLATGGCLAAAVRLTAGPEAFAWAYPVVMILYRPLSLFVYAPVGAWVADDAAVSARSRDLLLGGCWLGALFVFSAGLPFVALAAVLVHVALDPATIGQYLWIAFPPLMAGAAGGAAGGSIGALAFVAVRLLLRGRPDPPDPACPDPLRHPWTRRRVIALGTLIGYASIWVVVAVLWWEFTHLPPECLPVSCRD